MLKAQFKKVGKKKQLESLVRKDENIFFEVQFDLLKHNMT